MTAPWSKAVTQLLLAWSRGHRAALDALIPFVYDEIRRLADRSLRRERPEHMLQTTALVRELTVKREWSVAKAWLHREINRR
jgi:hypothetical protein